MFGRPIYNHILHKEDCLADPIRVLKLDMKTVTADDLEVRTQNIMQLCVVTRVDHGSALCLVTKGCTYNSFIASSKTSCLHVIM